MELGRKFKNMKFKAIKIFLILVVIFLLLELLVYFESSESCSLINNFGDAAWFMVVTLSTVGFGDKFPITLGGKLVTIVFIFASLSILSILIGRATNFVSERREYKKMGYKGCDFENHVVILRWDGFAKSISDILIKAKRKVAVITNDKTHIDLMYEEFPHSEFFALHAGYNDISLFSKVNIARSQIVFVNLKNDTDKLVAVLNLKRIYPNLNFMIILDESDLKTAFQAAGVNYVLSKNEIASKIIASFIFEPDVAIFNTDLLSHAESDEDFDIQEFYVSESNPFIHKTYGFVFDEIRSKYRSVLLGMSKNINGVRTMQKLPPNDTLIEKGDYLIFINNASSGQAIAKIFAVSEGFLG
ncbi:MAG: TrkA family potassium uptake protein [Bacteroidota bacterium]|nr:TrkA family potassium uptake protein [Bacteroidota bacterium]